MTKCHTTRLAQIPNGTNTNIHRELTAWDQSNCLLGFHYIPLMMFVMHGIKTTVRPRVLSEYLWTVNLT